MRPIGFHGYLIRLINKGCIISFCLGFDQINNKLLHMDNASTLFCLDTLLLCKIGYVGSEIQEDRHHTV